MRMYLGMLVHLVILNTLGKMTPFLLPIKAIVFKTGWHWHKNKKYRPMAQKRKATHLWSINLRLRRQESTLDKDSLFNKWCWENWTATGKRMNSEHFLTPYTKINSKWIKLLKVRPDTVKLLEEDTGRTVFDINLSITFLADRIMKIKPKPNKPT